MIPIDMKMVPYLVVMLSPVIMFFIVSMATEHRKYKAPIYWGFFAAIVASVVLYTLLPIIRGISG